MKAITSDNYLIRPFRTNKTWTVVYTHLGNSTTGSVRVDLAKAPPTDWDTWISSSDSINPDGTYQSLLYRSAQHTFYTGSKSDVTGSRYLVLGNKQKKFFPTGSNFYVVNITQNTFGEGIRPNTFQITSTTSTASIYDDGYGRLVSSMNTSSILGNIFYSVGIAVLQQDTGSYSGSLVTDRGLYVGTGSILNVQYDSIHTIYEHTVICTVDPGELNFSTNPTIRNRVLSGTFSGGSTFTQQTGSTASDLVFSGTLQPYFTTVGLFNDRQELVAVAKFPRALKRVVNTQQSVIIRIDM